MTSKLYNKWSVLGSAVTGSATGGWDKQLSNWSGVSGLIWTSDNQATSLNVTGTYGKTSTQSSRSWEMYNIVLQYKLTLKHYSFCIMSTVLLMAFIE
ncbi:outer membrane beta-barrel protein [Nitrosomonas sp.]|uniref:outer membrane beta-barrel protein n=1 Tax=Nitrosomonas sp. TaxID=42353 RepID=UPI0025EDC52A|nr:outer membrane beta-barrel protein [Nitrosomonas sp.]